MGPITRPFAPNYQATVNVSAGTTSANTTVTSSQNFAGSMRIYNSGAQDVFLEFGGAQNTASTTLSMPLKAGTTERFSVGKASHVATIVATQTSTVYITPGEGI